MIPKSLDDYIPLDKSWIIRMGVLDIAHGEPRILEFLSQLSDLSDDLLALQRVALTWRTSTAIDVGESGTLLRMLKFLAWKQGLKKDFILHGTLQERKVCDDPDVINWPAKRLLGLDGGTSQWASAAVLAGSTERITNPPYKLALTYEAITDWNAAHARGDVWQPRFDETIARQAEAAQQLLQTGKLAFTPLQAEDYCFARAFGLMTAAEGEQRWPALRNHESDRILEMEEQIILAKKGQPTTSRDHRVVQAIVLHGIATGTPVAAMYPEAVNKSWPQFWKSVDFLQFR